MMRVLPAWFKKDIPDINLIRERLNLLRNFNLHTVCVSAHCPNIGECFSNGNITFMIMGDICTRDCGFCAVDKGQPHQIDFQEPHTIAQVVSDLDLNYVVVTSVTRDDLSDGGASVFAKTINQIHRLRPRTTIEVLIPDFQGKESSIETLVETKPDVVGHNLETIQRLYPRVRPKGDYKQSLNILKRIKQFNKSITTKSAILLGLGETYSEVIQTLNDLRDADCDILTIGQYLSPSQKHLRVERFIEPKEFERYKRIGLSLGFRSVASGPFVRSSYNASQLYKGEIDNDKA
jgi:lipoic acid synthetase